MRDKEIIFKEAYRLWAEYEKAMETHTSLARGTGKTLAVLHASLAAETAKHEYIGALWIIKALGMVVEYEHWKEEQDEHKSEEITE